MVAEKISVITGLGAGHLIEIIGEIEAGDTVVIRGAERLKDGMSVQISTGLSKNTANSSSATQ
jgi:hypothetical protein